MEKVLASGIVIFLAPPALCTDTMCVLHSGFGSYLTGMGTVGYKLSGGSASPGNRIEDVFALSTINIIGYGLCIIFMGMQ